MGITMSSVVGASLHETFAWHQRPGAVRRLTPPFQPVRVVQEADNLENGTAVLRLPGGLRWVALHENADPPHGFADRLTSLPFSWCHQHSFEAVSADSTRVTDVVETPVPARILRPMFEYRHRQLADDLSAQQQLRAINPSPLTVGVTGASGLIGSALAAFLSTSGHRVVRYVRHPAKGPDERQWTTDDPAADMFDGIDAVVHLAGASIAGRFTKDHVATVRSSRIEPSSKLAQAMARASTRPSVLVSASAIGIYGPDRGDEVLTEASDRGDGVLADLVDDWEHALTPAEDAGIRVVKVRTGIVQSAAGGALKLLRRLIGTGLAGPVGTGGQWMSWVDIDDIVDMYGRALLDERVSGAINAVSENPATNREYTKTLARVLRRPAVIPAPAVFPRLLLGAEGAIELALASQRVVPAALRSHGYAFRRNDLEACLRHQLGRAPT